MLEVPVPGASGSFAQHAAVTGEMELEEDVKEETVRIKTGDVGGMTEVLEILNEISLRIGHLQKHKAILERKQRAPKQQDNLALLKQRLTGEHAKERRKGRKKRWWWRVIHLRTKFRVAASRMTYVCQSFATPA